MKLHESHRMGIVEGVRSCVRCYAGPDWPMIEVRCPGGDGDRERAHRVSARIRARRAQSKAIGKATR